MVVRSVRSRTCTPQPLSATATGLIADGAVGGRDGELVAVELDAGSTPSSRCTAADAPHRWSPSMRAMITSSPIERLSSSGVPSATSLPSVEDADAVGELVGLLEVLRGEEDRHAELGR